MTALVYVLQPKSVVIAMDSLSVDEDRRPHKFITKVFPFPHVRGVI